VRFIVSILLLSALFAPLKNSYPQEKINDIYVVLFILDGVPRDFLYGLIKDGKVPNIKEDFWDNGAHAGTTITTFPSASAPAYQGFITGVFAGGSGIPYLQWYDRYNEEEIDYLGSGYKRISADMWNIHAFRDPEIKGLNFPVTVFERLDGYPTAAVYSEISRGAQKRYPYLPLGALSDVFITKREDRLDIRALRRVKDIFTRRADRIPRFTLVGLYSTDVLQHLDGAFTENAGLAIRQFDIFWDEFKGLLKKQGIYDKTIVIVAADHGMHDIENNAEIAELLEKAGLKVKKTNLKKEKSDVYFSERGVASAHMYIKGGDVSEYGLDGLPNLERVKNYPVEGKGTVDIIELLRKEKTLDLVIVRNGHFKVEVYNRNCHGTILKTVFGGEDYYGYKVDNCDPLNYCEKKGIKELCGGKLYHDRTWFARSSEERYPDAVVQLGQVFDDGRAGDIFLTGSDRTGFYKCKAATHGSLIREDMNVPLLIHGADIPKGEFGPIRTVDIFPTLLSWFGLKDNIKSDGEPVFFSGQEKNGGAKAMLWPGKKDIMRELDTIGRLREKYQRLLSTLPKRDLRFSLVFGELERIKQLDKCYDSFLTENQSLSACLN